MASYKAFISYRKAHSEYAELIKVSLIEKYGFSAHEIFLDKHDVGPEYFDNTLRRAVKKSSSLILVVTKDCFVPKYDGEDWFLEEIQTALDNNVTIIPILFDDIKSLGTKEIREDLAESFTDEEVNKLVKTQSVRYDFDLSDATFSKLASFIETADKPDVKMKITRIAKVITAIVAVLVLVFAFFVGVGFLWGYFTCSTTDKDILIDNTHVEGNTAIFEFRGLQAKYDLDADSIYVNLENFSGEPPESNFEVLAQSCTVSGAFILFRDNVQYLKYFKFLKGGSKISKVALTCVSIAACAGSFCGFSQGSKWGRTLKQQDQALALFSKLKNKDEWAPFFAENIVLNYKYKSLQNKSLNSLLYNLDDEKIQNDVSTLTWCCPDEEITIARDAGLEKMSIICKFNDWEIGKGSANDLRNEINKAGTEVKDIVVFEIDSLDSKFKHFNLPKGIVGIQFYFPNKKSDIDPMIVLYYDWKSTKGETHYPVR